MWVLDAFFTPTALKLHVTLQVGNCMVWKGGVDPPLQLVIFGSLLQATGKQIHFSRT